MKNELLTYSELRPRRELEPRKLPVFVRQPGQVAADGGLMDARRLATVREEIAGIPIINVIVPVEQAKTAPPEPPKSIGEAVVDFVFLFLGAVFTNTGEFLEALERSQKSSNR